jgi:hypothetical protein
MMASMGPHIIGMFGDQGNIVNGSAELSEKFIDLAHYLDELLPDGRQKSIAFTELENASMRAHKSLSGIGY